MTSRNIAFPILRAAAARRAAGGLPRSSPSASAFLRPMSLAPAAATVSSSSFLMAGGWSSSSYSTTQATLNDDSHSDFAPQRKSIEDGDEAATQAMIKDHVTSNHIMLYMKGTPSMPMCGFSARVVGILQNEGVNFSSVNVLDYPSIREGVKKYAEWPTIPQLYVGGEFIGGCDIVMSMAESGELSELLKEGEEGKK